MFGWLKRKKRLQSLAPGALAVYDPTTHLQTIHPVSLLHSQSDSGSSSSDENAPCDSEAHDSFVNCDPGGFDAGGGGDSGGGGVSGDF